MEMSKITSKGQITIPKTIREELRLNEGDRVVFLRTKGGFIITNESTVTSGEIFLDGFTESAE